MKDFDLVQISKVFLDKRVLFGDVLFAVLKYMQPLVALGWLARRSPFGLGKLLMRRLV